MNSSVSVMGAVGRASTTVSVVSAVVLVWFLGVVAAAAAGALTSTRPFALPVGLAAILPPVIFALAYRFSAPFRNFVLNLNLGWLIMSHAWRLVGVSFLLLAVFGVLPWAFAIPAGVGDVIAAAAALLLAGLLFSQSAVPRRAIYWWNWFGLLDFAVAILVGTMSQRGGALHLDGTPTTQAFGQLPLALIPAFAVPLFVITHLIVFLQLRFRYADQQRIVLASERPVLGSARRLVEELRGTPPLRSA